ncbi:MAG TPA: hypothetical protein VJ983_06675 [candidate division Zixibacteria bacterium]|nr:hypothetical protein [candidate division Zixibacteria bacterium]
MNKHITRTKTGLWLTLVVVAALLASLAILPSCTNTLKGDQTANQKPIVQFVNIPPEGQRFSHNPEIYWVGNDRDGQITYYRYFVATVDSVGGTNDSAMAFIGALNDTMWTYVDIDPTAADPHTANTIKLSANLANPVNDYVPQYVFLQAFDNSGQGSDIVYRVLNRNDNPPGTNILYFDPREPFVNSVFPGGAISGLRLGWSGSDTKDYNELGLTPPPFQFEWKLFGPYEFSELNTPDSLWQPSLIRIVFVTEDARIFDKGDTLFRCDTTLVDTGGGSIIEEVCDTTVFDSTTANTNYYVRDTILNVNDTLFTNRLVEASTNGVDSWTMDTGDTLYNIYKNHQSDTTLTLRFVFWVRSRDDALVADLTPEFKQALVIDPRYEREVLVVDFDQKFPQNIYNSFVSFDTAKAFWYNTINSWLQQNPSTAGKTFDTTKINDPTHPNYITSPDYLVFKDASKIKLQTILKHKVMILYNESGQQGPGIFNDNNVNIPEIFTGIDAGVNAWATWRCPYVRSNQAPGIYSGPFDLLYYFGVVGYGWTQWFDRFMPQKPRPDSLRVEDFIGTYSIDQSQWPDIEIDTALLHQRLYWLPGFIPWIDTIAALPEVDWAQRAFGTEVMYLYKSKYGGDNPFGSIYNNEGSPCAHRYKTSLFRTVHMNFTPLTMKQPEIQELANSVLDWLYDPNLGGHGKIAVPENRYPDAPVKISIQQAKEMYNKRVQEDAAEAKAQGITH